MAITLEGGGTITGVTTLTTPLDDIQFDSIKITGIATAGTFQAGTGVSMASPRSQTLSFYTNNTEWLSIDDAGRVGIGTTNAQIAADTNNAKVVNAGIITANQYYGNQLTAVGSRVTGVGTFENGLNITGNITNGLNVSAGIATFQAVSGTTGTFSAAVSGTTGTFSGDVSIADKIIHTGDTDTAIRFAGNDIITAEIGGTETFRIDSSGLKITDKLIHSGDTDTFLEFGTNQITFDTGGTQRFELNNYGTYQPATVPLAFLATSGDSPNIKSGGTNANDLLFTTGNAERFRISSGGILGIGTEVPYSNGLLHCDGNIVLTASSNAPKIIFDEWGTGTDPKAQIEMDQTDSTNASLQFYTEGSGTLTERMRIDSSGRVLIGQTASLDDLQVGTPLLQLTKSSADLLSLRRNSADNGGPFLCFVKERSDAIVQDDDLVGSIGWFAHDGTDLDSYVSQIRCGIDGTPGANDTPGRLTFHTTADGSNRTTERMRITKEGRTLIGQTASYNVFATSKLQVSATDSEAATSITRWSANAHGPYINFGKSRSGTVGTYTVVQDGDDLGTINFAAADGTDIESVGASILAEVDGTPGSNDIPGRLVFKTTADGASTSTERMRIASGGDVIIGTTSWSYTKPLNVQGSSGAILALSNYDTTSYAADTNTGIEFRLKTGNTNNQDGSCEIRAFKENGTNGDNARGLSFWTAGNGGSPAERMRINSAGQVSFAAGGGLGGDAHVWIGGGRASGAGGGDGLSLHYAASTSSPIYFNSETTYPQKSIYMESYWMKIRGHNNEGVEIIGSNASSAADLLCKFEGKNLGGDCFNYQNSVDWDTTSDERIKTGITTITGSDGLSKISQLRPVHFDYTDNWCYYKGWTHNSEETGTVTGINTSLQKDNVGWIAQEYINVFPRDVKIKNTTVGLSTDHTEYAKCGVVTYSDFHTMSQNSVVPHLVAAIQELKTLNDALTTRVAALESA